MAKLNKTETVALEVLHERVALGYSPHYSFEWQHGQGRQGGRFSTGYRKYKAALSLVAKGYAKLLQRDSTSYCVGNGYFSSCAWVTIELIQGSQS